MGTLILMHILVSNMFLCVSMFPCFSDTVSNFVDIQMDQLETIADRTDFYLTRRTVIYLHGYNENIDEPSVMGVISAYLNTKKDVNLLSIDYSFWGGGNYLLNAVPNSKKVSFRC
jgi:hypothetical protein